MTDDREKPTPDADVPVPADAHATVDSPVLTDVSLDDVTRPSERRWVIGGALVGAAFAVVTALGLATTDGNALKAMAAAWLWLLPVSGIGAGAGWLLGRVMRRPSPSPMIATGTTEAVDG